MKIEVCDICGEHPVYAWQLATGESEFDGVETVRVMVRPAICAKHLAYAFDFLQTDDVCRVMFIKWWQKQKRYKDGVYTL